MSKLIKTCLKMVIAAASILVASGVSAATTPIGSAVYVVGKVDVVDLAGDIRSLITKEPISEGDVLVSGMNGLAVVVLVDNTKITIKPNSKVSIKEFLQGDEGNALIEIFEGGLRVITGKIADNQPDRFNIRTPLGSIGVRGTEFGVAECDRQCMQSSGQSTNQAYAEGSYLVPVWKGGVILKDCDPPLNVGGGQSGVISSSQQGSCELVPSIIRINIPTPAITANADHYHLTDNSHASRIDLDRRTFEEFKQWYDRGYPTASVLAHALSIGMPLEDAVYMSVKIDPSRDLEVLRIAEELSESIPGWMCYDASVQGKYAQEITVDDWGPGKTLGDVAELYRDSRRVLAPDTRSGAITLIVAKEELTGLIDDNRWYRAGEAGSANIFAIISTAGEITIDGDLDKINSTPGSTVPVIVIYMRANERVTSPLSDDMTLKQLLGEFTNEDKRVAPVWRPADLHKMASIEELRDVLALPDQDSIPPEELSRIESEIRNNGNQVITPLNLTLLPSGNGQVWMDKPAVAAVAESMGVAKIPVTLFFQDIGRQQCGAAPSTCLQNICDAAIAGGGRDNICELSQVQR